MHAILSNPNLSEIVTWAPHSRSWIILKPHKFVSTILSQYFEHTKMASFVRQANGWGFRRITTKCGNNAYYHEYFVKGMPWLCKKMRRPKVSEKKVWGPDVEPDFEAISKERPVEEREVSEEILMVMEVLEEGPRARMPSDWGEKDGEGRLIKKKRFDTMDGDTAEKMSAGEASSPLENAMAMQQRRANIDSLLQRAVPPPSLAASESANLDTPSPLSVAQLQLLLDRHNATKRLLNSSLSSNPTASATAARSMTAANAGLPSGLDPQFAAGYLAAMNHNSHQQHQLMGLAPIGLGSSVSASLGNSDAGINELLMRQAFAHRAAAAAAPSLLLNFFTTLGGMSGSGLSAGLGSSGGSGMTPQQLRAYQAIALAQSSDPFSNPFLRGNF
jgi:hypothetical protein